MRCSNKLEKGFLLYSYLYTCSAYLCWSEQQVWNSWGPKTWTHIGSENHSTCSITKWIQVWSTGNWRDFLVVKNWSHATGYSKDVIQHRVEHSIEVSRNSKFLDKLPGWQIDSEQITFFGKYIHILSLKEMKKYQKQ